MGNSIDTRLLTSGNEGDMPPTAPPAESTQYESLAGLNFNVQDPNAESSNEVDAESAFGATEYEGSVGGERADEALAAAAPDALLGSYDVSEISLSREVIIGPDDRVRVGNTTVYP